MQTLKFSIDIQATKEKVWQVLWEPDSFRDWTSIFADGSDGSHIKTDWEESGEFEFYESGAGSYGIIDQLIPNERVAFRHQGEVRNGEKLPNEKESLEIYTLSETDGITTLTLSHDIPDEHAEFFKEATPGAFARIKELAEA